MARKTKYTPEVVTKIKQAIEMGATFALAAAYAGISEATFYEWMNTKPEFSEAVKASEGLAAVKWLAKIEQAASDGNWQAAAWKLERRYPDSYGRQRIEHTGKDGNAIKVEDNLSDEQRVSRIAALLDAARTRRSGQTSSDE